jgi:hypothetical protein
MNDKFGTLKASVAQVVEVPPARVPGPIRLAAALRGGELFVTGRDAAVTPIANRAACNFNFRESTPCKRTIP